MTLLSAFLLSMTALASNDFDWRGEPGVVVSVLDVATLDELSAHGYTLGEMLDGKAESGAAALYESNARYRSIVDTVGKNIPHDPKTDQLPAEIPAGSGDIPELVRLYRGLEDKGSRGDKDLKGGFKIGPLANNSNFPYRVERDGDEPRHFDERWLRSPLASFRLIGIVNRLDRVDFHPERCGEVRLVFRLAYRTPATRSTLPFFLTVVKDYPRNNDCPDVPKRWIADSVHPSPELRAFFLNAWPLRTVKFRQVEMNFQSLRFTSGYMHDFGGQAMYMQRIFRPSGDGLAPAPLENTPDVLAIEKDPKLLERFVDFLNTGDHLRQLDEGRLQIDFDDRFLARLSVSWSTLGRAREANKPYSRLFRSRPDLLKKIPLDNMKFVRTPAALVERLNNLTCMGCHQSGGTAGFHLLGYSDDRYSHGFNRQELPLSPHAFAEAARRAAYVKALAELRTPNQFRPLSIFPEASWPKIRYSPLGSGQLCLVDKTAFADAPTCEAGSECKLTAKSPGALVGECVPKILSAGGTCWQGTLHEDSASAPLSYNFFAFRDKWHNDGALHAGSSYKCVLPQSGAPLGRASRACTVAEENFPALRDPLPFEACANQGGNGFDECAASGDSGACLESRVVRSMLDTCSPGRFCREDYICQRFPDYSKIAPAFYDKKKAGKRVNASEPKKISGENIRAAWDKHVGFCVPTYFLFNMRADGHPSPVTGKAPGAPVIDPKLPLRGYK